MNPNAVAPQRQQERRFGHSQLPPLDLGVSPNPNRKRLGKSEEVKDKLEMQPLEQFNKQRYTNDHILSVEQFCSKYQTDPKRGLTGAEAQRRFKQDGPNQLRAATPTHWSLRLLKEMVEPFSLLLWLAAALSFVSYDLYHDPNNLGIGIALCFIIVCNGLIQFSVSQKELQAEQPLRDFLPPQVTVIREGSQRRMEATRLVKGDVVRLEFGRKVPADVRIINSQGLKISGKNHQSDDYVLLCVESTSPNPVESRNIAYFSNLVREGSGTAIVVETGRRTYFGKMFDDHSISTLRKPDPVDEKLRQFTKWLSVAVIIVVVALFCLGFGLKYPPQTNLQYAIGMLIAGVPEGLLFEILVIKLINVTRISRRKILSKSVATLQRLNTVSCIITDYMGILTKNKLEASQLWYNGSIHAADSPEKYGEDHQYQFDPEQPGFKSLLESAAICTTAVFEAAPSMENLFTSAHANQTLAHINNAAQRKSLDESYFINSKKFYKAEVIGDPSEAALLRFFYSFDDLIKLRTASPIAIGSSGRQYRMPFNNKHAYAIHNHSTLDSEYTLFTRGSPERVWAMCTHVLVGGRPVPKVETWEGKFRQAVDNFTNGGERLIAFAKLQLPRREFPAGYAFNTDRPNFPINQQCFVGLVSLRDPPRDGVIHSIKNCQAAGIKTIMITGNTVEAATANARSLHLITGQTANEIAEEKDMAMGDAIDESNAIVVDGDDLRRFEEEDQNLPIQERGRRLEEILSKEQIVFARTGPAEKLKILKACKNAGEIVAVVVNDSNSQPLREADVGVVLESSSNYNSKEAADLILLNDDFSTLAAAIAESRCNFDNIKKSIAFVLTSQWARMLPYIGLIAFQFPLPLSAATLLYISLVTDLIPAIAFAFEEPQANLMSRRLKNKESELITGRLIASTYGSIGFTEAWGAFFAYYTVVYDFGFRAADLNGKASIYVVQHSPIDSYNPSSPFFGNSNLQHSYSTQCPTTSNSILLDWNGIRHATQDLRMVALSCIMNQTTGLPTYKQLFNWSRCRTYQISPVSNAPVCYSTEALKYGQSAFLFGLVICQTINLIMCRTRRTSVVLHGMNNSYLNLSILFSLLACILVAYFLPFNIAFNTRDNIFMHFGTPAIPFALGILIIEEMRKLFAVVFKPDATGKPNWWERLTVW